jgi:superfamily II DNA or RNA helicase
MPPLTPRPYQELGMEFLYNKKRAMLTDPPGLGKTLQATEAAMPPTLIAAPAYLVEQWYTFLTEQYPRANIGAAEGTRKQREHVVNFKPPLDFTVINIEMLRTYQFPPHYNTFIVDESHHLRGHNSQQARAALVIAKRTPRVYLLTGTPIKKEVDDLYMQLRLLDPQIFTSYWRFAEMFCRIAHTAWGDKIVGPRNPDALRRLLLRYALGRSYRDVSMYLPPLIEQVITITPQQDWYRLYDSTRRTYNIKDINLNSASEVINTLRRLTLLPQKIDTIRHIVEDAPNGTVVFTWFRDTAEQLADALRVPFVHGGTKDRVQVAHQHNTFTATIAAIGEGVDLTHCKTVVFAEQSYVYGDNYQALSRVRRHTADHAPIRAYTVIVRRSIDEIIHRLSNRRGTSAYEVLREALR